MAFLQSIFTTSMLLLAMLAIASATDYGYGSTPKLENPNTESAPVYGYSPTPKVENTKPESAPVYGYNPTPESAPVYEYSPTPKVENTKPESAPVYGYSPTPKVENPKPETNYYKSHPAKPDYKVPKPKGKDEVQLLPTIIAVQGVVLCKSGSNYSPIQGAVARFTCGSVDEFGYETGPISVLSHVTDNKGYFFATLSLDELGSKLKLTECKAYLESSPLETCKVPSDVNYGISGSRLSSYRLLENKMKLYTVGPFFCTSQPESSPNGY